MRTQNTHSFIDWSCGVWEIRKLILEWVGKQSGSDYIRVINALMCKTLGAESLSMEDLHHPAMLMVSALERKRRGTFDRHVAECSHSVWKYTIGGIRGKTSVEFSYEDIIVRSWVNGWVNTPDGDSVLTRYEKGSLRLSLRETTTPHIVVIWEGQFKERHSWGRLQDVVRYLQRELEARYVPFKGHKIEMPEEVEKYEWDREEGGSW